MKDHTNTSDGEAHHSALVKNEVEHKISLEGELKPDDYVTDIALSQKTSDEVEAWTTKQKERTRTQVATRLVQTFVFSSGMILVIAGIAAFNPKADKTFIKEIIPLVITPQATIIAGAVGYYFGSTQGKS